MRDHTVSRLRFSIVVACATLCCAAAASAGDVDPAAIAQALQQRATEDAALRADYSWKERTEVTVEDETKLIRIELHRVDRDGVAQVSVLSEERPEPRRNRGLQARVMAHRAEKLDKQVAAVTAFLAPYELPTAGAVLDFVNSATVLPGDEAGTSRLRAVDVVQPGDVLTLHVDDATGRILRRAVRTAYDDGEVGVIAEYDALDSGLGYPARTTVSITADRTRIVTERFDHTRQ